MPARTEQLVSVFQLYYVVKAEFVQIIVLYSMHSYFGCPD
jgi:hypothetical protein